MIAVAMVAAVAGPAAAQHAGFGWTAPANCPSVSSIEARVEQRLGRPLEAAFVASITIAVERHDGHYVARLELGPDVRSLTSDRCEELADAIALIITRLADEQRATVQAPAPRVALASLEAPTTVHRELAAIEPPHPWSLGVRLSGVSGIGIVPEVGLGAEIAISARYHAWLGELAATKWLAAGADGQDVASHVDVGLGVTSARLGWRSETVPLRAWLGAEVGSMDGTGTNLSTTQPNSGRWFAAGGGFGVGWPMTPWLRVVGSTEILLAIERVRFAESNGTVIYAPSPMSARATLGIEVGWE